jgi:hypothetical protein
LWKSFRYKLQTASELSLLDWLFLIEAWWGLLGFYLAIRLVSFDRLEAFTHVTTKKKKAPSGALAWAWGRQRLVSLAARLHLLSMTCLPRALTLRWMLGRNGIPAQLCLGMNRSSTGLLAHAWVEMEGQAIGEPEDISDRFKILGPMQK